MKLAFVDGDLCMLVNGEKAGDPVCRWERVPFISADDAKTFEVLEEIKPDYHTELQQAYEVDGWVPAVRMHMDHASCKYAEAKAVVFGMARENAWTFRQE